MKALYIRYQGDQYLVHVSLTGEIVSVVVYRDNCNASEEIVPLTEIPSQVFEQVQSRIAVGGPTPTILTEFDL